MKITLQLVLCLATAVTVSAQVIANPTAEPAQIRIGQSSKVRFFADISNPNVVPGSVNLQRMGASGTNPIVVATLNDNGTNGDEIQGDGRYSVELTFNEAAATILNYTISAAIQGQVVRPRSAQFSLSAVNNRAPVALGGPNRSIKTALPVQLDGRQSYDLDGDLLRFTWSLSKPNGSAATLDNLNFVKPSFTPDLPGTYVASLIVNDGQVDSFLSQVTIVAAASNAAPTASIGGLLRLPFGSGPTSINTLNASASSDPEGSALTYLWTLVSKPASSTAATFSPLNTATPTLTADKPGRYVVRLIVNDGALASNPVEETIIFYRPNTVPIVSSGADQSTAGANLISLLGSASDVDAGDSIAAVSWTFIAKPQGSVATILNAASLNASFTPDLNGDYLIELIATDTKGFLSRSRIVVRRTSPIAPPSNLAPNVSAGSAQSITLPSSVNLLATATDDNLPNPPAALTFSWTRLSGPSASVVFSAPNALATTASFQVPGVYVLRFTASDSALSSSSDVTITVNDSGPVLPAISDRTIPLGSTFRLMLSAASTNPGAALSFSLPTAPSGALLNPSPMIDWTPTNAQLGWNTFTARVVDGQGRFDVKTFRVNVTADNRPPVLAPQQDASQALGSAFSRTLTATDPDAANTLTFALISGPAGMTINGANLAWTVQGPTYVPNPVIVRVTDQAGLSDVEKFNITPLPAAAPVATDDAYLVQTGQTLNVNPPGVLANDTNPGGGAFTATKLTNPAIGNLSAFQPNGAFTFVAPASLPAAVFSPTPLYTIAESTLLSSNPLVADLNGDHKAETVIAVSNNPLRVYTDNGALLWSSNFAGTPWSDCRLNIVGLNTAYPVALGDIDDDGSMEVVGIATCDRDTSQLNGRIVAFQGATGAIKWMSPVLAALPLPATGSTGGIDFTYKASPTIARLRQGESPSVLINFYEGYRSRVEVDEIGNPTNNSPYRCLWHHPEANVPWCSGVIVLNGADGTVRQRMWAPRSFGQRIDTHFENQGYVAPIVADLDGNGTPEIVSGATAFAADGSLLHGETGYATTDLAVANFDDTPDLEILRAERTNIGLERITAYKMNGSILWRIVPAETNSAGMFTIADLDSSGRPSILINIADTIWAYDYKGNVRWTYTLPASKLSARVRVGAFDLDGDGVMEVIVPALERLIFLDGATGTEKFVFHASSIGGANVNSSNVSYTNPGVVIADVDNSGQASVLYFWTANDLTASGRLTWLKSQGTPWKPARRIYNQQAYFAANVNDNGSIPALPFPAPTTNLYGGTQPRIGSLVDPRQRYRTSFTYSASANGLTSNAATVTLDIAPNNRPPVFTSVPPTRFLINGAFSFQASATDPDPGDQITFSLKYASYTGGTCAIGATTGLFTCTFIQTLNDAHASFVIAATDSFGAVALQTLNLKGVTSSSSVPNVVGLAQAAAIAALQAAGLNAGAITPVASNAPAGNVVAQSPNGGSLLNGEQVALSVSSGPAPIPVPFVTGLALTTANTTLGSAGFSSTVTRVFSNTVPANVVISQNPAAGVLRSPTAANPVALVVSSGNGLRLDLSRTLITANQNIAVTPSAFDANGQPAALPSLTYAITPSLLPQTGAIPTVAANVINVGATTRGAYTITATDTANNRSASAEFVVLPPVVAGETTHGESFAKLIQALDQIFALRPALIAARDANNTTQMRNLLQQMIGIWRTVDLEDLKRAYPLVAEDKFMPTAADLTALGLSATPTDLLVNQILRDANDDIRAFSDGLKAQGTTIAQLQAMADRFSTRAARMDGLAVTEFGGVMNATEYRRYLSLRMPAFFEALMNELAPVAGLTPRKPIFPNYFLLDLSGFAETQLEFGGPRFKIPIRHESTLAELTVTQAVNFVVEKIMDAASQTYRNAKEFAVNAHKQAAWTAVAVATAQHLKEFTQGGDIDAVISGASLSFRIFSEPDLPASPAPNPAPLYAQGIVEVTTDGRDPEVTTVMMIGIDTMEAGAAGVKSLYDSLKSATSYGTNPANNPLRARNLGQIKRITDEMYAKLKAVKNSFNQLKDVIDGSYQTPTGVLPGCIFSADPRCTQLIYDDGIRPVYRYTPPPGWGGLGGLPAAVIFIVQADTGNMYFGTPLFLPAPKRPEPAP